MQYTLTLTEEVEIRYREEERTNTWTDEDGNEHEELIRFKCRMSTISSMWS